MFKKNILKKTNVILLIVFVLNLGLGILFLAPTQTQAFLDPQAVVGMMTDLNSGTEAADIARAKLINAIQNGQIPEELKSYVISSISNAENIPENTKNLITDLIQENENIPEEFKSLIIDAINGNNDISGLAKNWILDLLLKHVDIEHICKSLSDAAANIMIFGTTVGTPAAIFITQMCPIILNEMLQAFLETLPEPQAPSNIQTIQYPIFESYQWEIGIPGLVKPGEVTEF